MASHLSLEDPLLRKFIGEFVATMLENPGMKKDEPRECQLVSRRMKAAQMKIEQRAFGNSRAFSAAEWLELDMPNV